MCQFLGPEMVKMVSIISDVMGQFLVPETDTMGYFMDNWQFSLSGFLSPGNLVAWALDW